MRAIRVIAIGLLAVSLAACESRTDRTDGGGILLSISDFDGLPIAISVNSSTGFVHDGPAAVRYPRGTGPGVVVEAEMTPLPIGAGQVRRLGSRVALLAFGSMLTPALEAAESLDATVANMRFVKPLDEDLVLRLATDHQLLVTLEENATMGGAGSAVGECLAAHAVTVPILNLGLPDRFLPHGSRGELLSDCGLDTPGILEAIRAFTPSLTTVGAVWSSRQRPSKIVN